MYLSRFYRTVKTFTDKVQRMDVRYWYTAVMSICIIWLMIMTVFMLSRPGWYLRGIDLLYCTSTSTCLHESAHRMDWYLGNVSRSPEYLAALSEFGRGDHPWSAVVQNYHGSPSELYAQMYESAGGDMDAIPERLRIFYSGGWNNGNH